MGLRHIVYLGLSFLYFTVNAQNADFQEEVYVSVHSTNVLVGERLYFSAFVYSNTTKELSNLSSILYVELVDEQGKSVYQTKIGLRQGRGSGSIYINPDWLSSSYRLVAYTRWMKNYLSYWEQKILVFNPYNGIFKNDSIIGDPLINEVNEELISTSYNSLQQVSMNLGPIERGTLSISINKTNNLYYPNAITLVEPTATMQAYQVLPEYRYGMVQGRLKKAGELNALRLNMTMNGSGMQFATTKTDANGNFWMSYNPDTNPKNALVQLDSDEDLDYEIEFINEFYEKHPSLKSSQVKLDSKTQEALITRSVNNQILSAYQASSEDVTKTLQLFSLPSAEIYYLDDYKRFTSIRDTFIELTIYVGVSKSETNYKMNVRCDSEIPGLIDTDVPPLLLLDGLKVSAKEILDLSPNDIEKIEVVPEYYFANDLVFKGVVSVHSFKRKPLDIDFEGSMFSLAGYQPYSIEGFELELEERMPLYNHSLLWIPIHHHTGGNFSVDFATPRLAGVYEVTIRGIAENGSPINLVRRFSVSGSSQ